MAGGKRKKLAAGFLIGLAGGALAVVLEAAGPLQRWEDATWDWRERLFAAPSPATDRIRLVLLDQKSLDWGKNENGWAWPWPREVYGAVLAFLGRSGARVAALDVLYTEPSVWSVGDDLRLVEAVAAGQPPVVGALSLSRDTAAASVFPEGLPGVPLRGEGWEALAARSRPRFRSATIPIPEYAAACRLLANVTEFPDQDSVFRRAAPVAFLGGEPVASLGLGAYLVPVPETVPAYAAGVLRLGEARIPLDGEGKAVLRYPGGTEVYRPVSAAAVIRSEALIQGGEPPELDPEFFRDRYVLFGFSAGGLLDLRATPVSPVAPGVLVHAVMLDNLLAGGFLRETPPALTAAGSIVLALIAGLLVSRSRKASRSVVVCAIVLTLPWIAGFAAYRAGYVWPIVAPEAGAVLALFGGMVYRYATEGRQKAFIKSAFRHYLSPEVVEKLLEDPGRLTLGGERRELTIFFSDLQGFSTFSEKLGPVELTGLLNDYLSEMTDIILEEGGTLDKYEGDAIIAFWNAPLEQEDHAVRAVRAAVRCQARLDGIRETLRERYGALLKMRIGLNTGEVVVGNMGSRERFDYTVLGDAANLASRLEGANKAFGTFIMVSAFTWEKTGGVFPGRELGDLRVVGRREPVRVYEPLGDTGAAAAPRAEAFARGLELCRAGDWAGAAGIFEGLPNDPAAAVYLARCRELASGKGAWDGVWNLENK